MMVWLRQMFSLLLVVLLTGSTIAQTFQYSRGWTNGKRAGYPLSPSGCQLQRLRAILEGKASPADSSYLLCEMFRVPEDELRLEHVNKIHPRNSIPEEIVEK